MKKKIIVVFIAVVFFCVMLIYFSNRFINKRVEKELTMLQATAYVLQDFDMYSLDSIPKPLLSYISNSLNKNYKYYRMVEITYNGQIKLNRIEKNRDCSGKIFFGQYQPGLLHTETINIFPLIWDKKRNFYIDGNGSILIKKMSVFTTQNLKGLEVNQTELSKFIAFSPIYPWIFLNRGIFNYISFDSSSVKIEVKDKNNKINLDIKISGNQITEIKTKDYFSFTEKEGSQQELQVKYSDYQTINGVIIPKTIEASLIDNIKSYLHFKYTIEEYKYY